MNETAQAQLAAIAARCELVAGFIYTMVSFCRCRA